MMNKRRTLENSLEEPQMASPQGGFRMKTTYRVGGAVSSSHNYDYEGPLKRKSQLVVRDSSDVRGGFRSGFQTVDENGYNYHKFYQSRPITESRPSRRPAIETDGKGDEQPPSLMNFSSKVRRSGGGGGGGAINFNAKPVQQLTQNQAALIAKKGFLRREQFTGQMSKSVNSSIRPRTMQQPYSSQYNYVSSGAVDDDGTSIVKQRRALNAENYRNGVERQVYNTAT